MKKRISNKRQILGFASIVIVFCYIVSMVALYIVGLNNTHAYFYRFTENYHDELVSKVYSLGIEQNDNKFTEENFMYSVFSPFSYSGIMMLFDENGDVVHTSGSYIVFDDENKKERVCYLDEHFKKTEMEKLWEFSETSGAPHIKSFKYYESQEGDIVPVSLVVCDTYPDGDYPEGFEITELEIVGDKSYKGDIKEYTETYGLNVYPETKKRKELKNIALSEEYMNEMKDDLRRVSEQYTLFANTCGSSSGSDFASYDGCVELSGELYYYIICYGYDEFVSVINSDSGTFVTTTLLFLILTVVVLIMISKFYDKNKAFEESKKAFISAMTHEMKTPIAIIQNQCECIIENISPEKNETYIKSIHDEALKMNKLVTDMLQYNRITELNNITLEKVDLGEVVKEAVHEYKPQFELHEKVLTLDIKENTNVKCDKTLIKLVIDNMLSNTIKHTENGGEVIVTVKDSAEGYKFSVYNSGSTVPENEKDKIWSVLYKTDKSRTERDKSSGVGLAVSAKILDLHKANYGCVNVNDGVEFYFNIK